MKANEATDAMRDWFFTHEEYLVGMDKAEAHDVLLAKGHELGMTQKDMVNSFAALTLCFLVWMDIAKTDGMSLSQYTSRLAEIDQFRDEC